MPGPDSLLFKFQWYLGLLPVLTVIALVFFLRYRFLPSWILLTRSLPRHRHMNPTIQALFTLFRLMAGGLQVLSLLTATRLRIEIELLIEAPERPLRLNSENKAEYRLTKKEWKTEKGAWQSEVGTLLAGLMRLDEEERTIEIDECSPLIDNDDIARYFDALSPRKDPFFLSKVTIRSGFVAPTHLLTGLVARYEDDWRPVIEGYGAAVIRPRDPFARHRARKMQAFIFDCWLLWGPSIPICTCPEWQGEVALQYGYGDENNSLSLRCSSPDVYRTLRNQPGAVAEGFALRARVTGKLKWGPALDHAGFCPAQTAIWQDDRLVLDTTAEEALGVRPAGGTEKQVSSKFYSAYQWVALVMCKDDGGGPEPINPKHKWRDLIPFFIHGNIADNEAYEFHANQLARGVVEAALLLLDAERDLVLCFACAIDETACGYQMLCPMPSKEHIRQKMRRFAKDAVKTPDDETALRRLNLDFGAEKPFHRGDYSACRLPEIVNRYYEDIKDIKDAKDAKDAKDDTLEEETASKETLTFRELRFTRTADMNLLKTFYEDCFEPEFPDENERESLQNIQNFLRLKETGWYQKNNYHVIVVLDGADKPIAGAIADYLDRPNAGVIEYFVVLPERRKAGLGRRLLEATERTLHDDADRSRQRPLDWIVAEIDDPFLTPRPTHGIDCFALARTWEMLGYRLLDFPYRQPALAKGKQPVETLLLTAKLCPEGRFMDPPRDEHSRSGPESAMRTAVKDWGSQADGGQPKGVPSADVNDLLIEYMRWGIEPEGNDDSGAARREVYDGMYNFLQRNAPENDLKNGSVKLVSFNDYLGWSSTKHLQINEVVSASDPELNKAIKVYEQVFDHGDTAIASDEFRHAFEPGKLAHQRGYRYHLWTIRSNAGDCEGGPCQGMASFLTMPSAGFGGYLALLPPLGQSSGILPGLIARIEERMVRDGTPDRLPDPLPDGAFDGNGLRSRLSRLYKRVREWTVRVSTPRYEPVRTQDTEFDGKRPRGWYIECDDETRKIYEKVGFRVVDVKYRQPPLGDRDNGPVLSLMYKPFGRVYDPPVIEKKDFLQAMREIYSSIYGMDESKSNERSAGLKLKGDRVETKPPAGES